MRVLFRFLSTLISSLGLAVVPYPIGPLEGVLAGKRQRGGDLRFYSHPPFVVVMHLIVAGWLVAAGAAWNGYAVAEGYWLVPVETMSWLWLGTLLITTIVQGLRFGRVQLGFLVAATAIAALLLTTLQFWKQVPVFGSLAEALARIPVDFDLGIPIVTSAVLGLTFAIVAAWQRLNDTWIVPNKGNFIEHLNFQQRDIAISKGAKSFMATFPCLLRRYLCFGYGDIEIRGPGGGRVLKRIEGVFWARKKAAVLRHRFGTTDILEVDADIDAEAEDDIAAQGAL